MHDESLSYLRRLELGAETVHPKVSTAQYAEQLRELADELLELVGPPAVPYSANAAELAALRRQQLDQQLNALRRLAGLAAARLELVEHSVELLAVDATKLERQHVAVVEAVRKSLNECGYCEEVGTMPSTVAYVERGRERDPGFHAGEPGRVQFAHLLNNAPKVRAARRLLDEANARGVEAAKLLEESRKLEVEITNYTCNQLQEAALS